MENQAADNTSSFITNLMSNEIISYALKIVGAILVIILLLIIAKIVAGVIKRSIIKHNALGGGQHVDKIADLIRDVVYYILVIFAFFIGFEMIGFDVGLILGGVSFGVGLAFKEILGNMIAGIMILYTKEFKLGDIVEVQADQVYFGRIEEITIRYTVVRTLDLRQVVLPNMTLISVPIKTFSAEDIVKLTTKIGIHYDSDVTKAIEVATNAINSLDFVKNQESTSVYVTDFAESSIDLLCIFYFDPKAGLIGDYAVGYVNEAIREALHQNGIKIPYPHTTLTFETNEDKQKLVNTIQEDQ